MKWKLFLILLVFIISSASVLSVNYYADVEIFVANDGTVSFDGVTNHPDLMVESSQKYTSKNGIYWLVNITLEGVFSDYVYELHLPQGSQINYIKTPQLSRIVDDDGVTIIGTGEKNYFTVIAQYTLMPISSKSKKFLYALGPIVLLILLVFFYFKTKKKSLKPSYNSDALTDRQKQIVKLLEKSKKPITQAFLEKQTGLPKSSLSRNIDSLIRKGIIEKEAKGMSNIIFFKKE